MTARFSYYYPVLAVSFLREIPLWCIWPCLCSPMATATATSTTTTTHPDSAGWKSLLRDYPHSGITPARLFNLRLRRHAKPCKAMHASDAEEAMLESVTPEKANKTNACFAKWSRRCRGCSLLDLFGPLWAVLSIFGVLFVPFSLTDNVASQHLSP